MATDRLKSCVHGFIYLYTRSDRMVLYCRDSVGKLVRRGNKLSLDSDWDNKFLDSIYA